MIILLDYSAFLVVFLAVVVFLVVVFLVSTFSVVSFLVVVFLAAVFLALAASSLTSFTEALLLAATAFGSYFLPFKASLENYGLQELMLLVE